MNGIIVVNKPKQMTSHDVVNIVRKSVQSKKVGHTGTLDPDATGVLVVAINEATKLIPFLEEVDKTYRCEIVIGYATTTEDASGELTEQLQVDTLSTDEVDRILSMLVGPLKQTPPMYSAVKVDGKKLYQYARNNEIVERPTKDVIIYELTKTSSITITNHTAQFSFVARVSRGTYIRTLCVEIGRRLGFPAHMGSLVRLSSGKFSLEDANTIDEVKARNFQVKSMLEALSHLSVIKVSDPLLSKINNGMKISQVEFNTEVQRVVITTQDDRLLAIYEKHEDIYKAVRVWK